MKLITHPVLDFNNFQKKSRVMRLHELKYMFIVFYLFGQTAFIPLKNNKKKNILIVISYFTRSIYLMILVGTMYSLLLTFEFEHKSVEFNTLIIRFAVVLLSTSGFFVLYISLVNFHSLRKLCEKIDANIQYIELHLKSVVRINDIKRSFFRKLVVLLSLFMISTIEKYSKRIILHRTLPKILVSFSYLYRNFLILHIIVYIHLVEVIILALNQRLKAVQKTFEFYTILHTLRHITRAHNYLCETVTFINKRYIYIIIAYY